MPASWVQKAFDTVDCCVVWQVLWKAGILGHILGCNKATHACDSAAVKTKQKISETFSVIYRGETDLRAQP